MSPTTPESVLTVRVESERGIYYHVPGDRVEFAMQEAYYEWLIVRAGLKPTQRFVFFKYRDRNHMRAVTGVSGKAWAEGGNYRFHTIWPTCRPSPVAFGPSWAPFRCKQRKLPSPPRKGEKLFGRLNRRTDLSVESGEHQ